MDIGGQDSAMYDDDADLTAIREHLNPGLVTTKFLLDRVQSATKDNEVTAALVAAIMMLEAELRGI